MPCHLISDIYHLRRWPADAHIPSWLLRWVARRSNYGSPLNCLTFQETPSQLYLHLRRTYPEWLTMSTTVELFEEQEDVRVIARAGCLSVAEAAAAADVSGESGLKVDRRGRCGSLSLRTDEMIRGCTTKIRLAVLEESLGLLHVWGCQAPKAAPGVELLATNATICCFTFHFVAQLIPATKQQKQ